MKKIGVITWFNGPNYGTVLQAVALQSVLRSMNVLPELINFNPPAPNRTFRKKVKEYIPRKIEAFKQKIILSKYRTDITNRDVKTKKFVSDFCVFSSLICSENLFIRECNKFDILVFGSDQIWNPNWFHPYYYADYDEINTARVAYAPSLGVCDIPNDMIQKYKNALGRFYSVSVRESIAVRLLKEKIGIACNQVVDPVFLLTSEEWTDLVKLKSISERYALMYLLEDNDNHIKASLRFAKSKNIKIKVIPYQLGTYFMKTDICSSTGPKEFLELIKNAECIITDSFHAIVFSIIFKKEFYALTRFDDNNSNSQNSRIYQIINEYGLNGRLQNFNTRLIKEDQPIDYESLYKLLDQQKIYSKTYLWKLLEEI